MSAIRPKFKILSSSFFSNILILILLINSTNFKSCHENVTSNPEVAKFSCQSCEYATDKKQQLEEHSRISHPIERAHDCQQCEFESTSKSDLDDHILRKHPMPVHFKCDLCEKIFTEKEELSEHYITSHQTQNFRCHKCKFVTKSKAEMENHSCNHDDISIILKNCDLCSYQALHDSDLRVHKQTIHDSQNLVLRALKELAENVRTLSNDLLDLKSNSIIIEKDIFTFVKSDIIEEINKNTNEKFSKVWDKVTDVKAEIVKLDAAQMMTEDRRDDKDVESKDSEGPKKPLKRKSSEDKTGKVNDKSTNKRITWFGTSLSTSLDKSKLEKDTNMDVKVVKAYCIQPEEKFPDLSFTKTVPEELKSDTPDIAVLQTGEIEITNIDVKKAMMDTSKDIKEYEKEWTEKVEKDSENLFNLALKMTETHKNMKVVILKRLPRFDPTKLDPRSIKNHLSVFANSVYDHLYLKHNSPANIQIAELNLGTDEYPHLKKIVMGNPETSAYDGVNLRGSESLRHFTYRAVQLIKSITGYTHAQNVNLRHKYSMQQKDEDHTYCPQSLYQRLQKVKVMSKYSAQNEGYYDHTNCPQASYQRQQSATRGYEAGQSTQYAYNIPIRNSFNVLGN